MIHFVPDFLLPAKFEGNERRYLKECISLAVLFILCILVNFFHNSPESGLLPEFISQWRFRVHGPEMCPLCGATRSFLFMCRGDIVAAAHYSFFGVFFFFGALIHLGIKSAYLLRWRKPLIFNILNAIDRHVIILWSVFILWVLQLLLHFSGIFAWYTIAGQRLFNFQI